MQRRSFSLVTSSNLFAARRFASSSTTCATTAAAAGITTASSSTLWMKSPMTMLMNNASVINMTSNNTPNMLVTRRYSSTRSALHDQTNSEIQGEESNTADPEPQVPAGWALSHKLGTNYFTGTKTFGDQTLSLYCPLRSPRATTAARESGDEDGAASQPFSVLINRSGNKSSMFVNLSVVGGELVVEQIRMLDGPVGEKDAMDFHRELGDKAVSSYEGPGIFELEEPFADPLFNFLEECGLSDEFAEFVALYAYHTEQREYINWLQKLSAFTA